MALAAVAGRAADFFLDATDGGSLTKYSEYIKTVTFSPEREMLELPRIGNNAVSKLVGSVSTEIEIEGWWDATIDEVFEVAFTSTPTATRSFEYAPAGSASGSRKYSGECWIVSYEVETDAEDAATFTATLAVDGAITQGTYS